jgi:hypothetical protein
VATSLAAGRTLWFYVTRWGKDCGLSMHRMTTNRYRTVVPYRHLGSLGSVALKIEHPPRCRRDWCEGRRGTRDIRADAAGGGDS